ncbi:alpha/beta hydrolase [Roseobacter sp. YSTF-M11]|uniref:Alpha/beta hydrolase n=1 Tax=Roseobacter insulae TaxID=2859783 RepID=A0A9X1FYD0_9RHOB|nr:alpha/beta hydrolase [Roseobacter insulae]MBW4709956.1 alpha/beta hydrolase [Roseobacter insulae]
MGSRIASLALRIVFFAALLAVTALAIFHLAAALRETAGLGEDLPPSGQMVTTGDGVFFTRAKGQSARPQVLFAHGTAAWSGLWEPTLEAVAAAGYHAVAFDMPPFGYSEHAGDTNYARQRQALRLIALLETLGTKPIFVAHSVGAGPAAEAIMMRPDLVSGFIVVDGAIGLNAHETPKSLPFVLRNRGLRAALVAATAANPLLTKRFLQDFMHVKGAATPDIVDVLQRPMTRRGYTDAVAAWVPELLVPPRDAASTRPDNWRALTVPTAFIWGDRDTVTPPAQAETLHALVTGSQLLMLPGVGHIPQLEAQPEFQNALLVALEHVRR